MARCFWKVERDFALLKIVMGRDKAQVHFRFVKHPEFLKENQRLVFREGRTKAVGKKHDSMY